MLGVHLIFTLLSLLFCNFFQV